MKTMSKKQYTAIGVSVVLMNEEGQILGVTRKDDHNDWGLPGGKVEPGEKKKAALARELMEETGLELEPGSLEEIYREEKDGKLDVTYIGVANGKVKHDEPHLVGWVGLGELMNSPTFGDYNRAVFWAINEITHSQIEL